MQPSGEAAGVMRRKIGGPPSPRSANPADHGPRQRRANMPSLPDVGTWASSQNAVHLVSHVTHSQNLCLSDDYCLTGVHLKVAATKLQISTTTTTTTTEN